MAGEWKRTSLREAGVSLIDCDHRTPPAADAGYPYVAIPQLKEGRLDISDVRRISPEHFVEWTRKAKPQHHDVILSRRCNPGDTAYVPAGLECALGQNLVLLRSDGTKVFPPFLRWLVRGPDWWAQVGTFINVGAVFDSLKCADIPNFRLPLPPLTEQKAIAAVLGALDNKIELNHRTNETLESMARAIFKSWFVDFDPVRAKVEGRRPVGMDAETAALFPANFASSPEGRIPSGWQWKLLGEVADVNWGDTSTTKASYVPSGYAAFSASGSDGYLPHFDFDRTGVVVSAIGANAGTTWLATGKWSCIKNTIRFWATDGSLSTEFLFHSTLGQDKWPLRGSAQPFIAQGDARRVPILRPSSDLGRYFGVVVRSFYEQIDAVLGQNRTLAALRDTLLPKLLAGEIRIRDAEKMIETRA